MDQESLSVENQFCRVLLEVPEVDNMGQVDLDVISKHLKFCGGRRLDYILYAIGEKSITITLRMVEIQIDGFVG